MCRLVGYLGDDIQVSSLITDSDQSLTRQATDSSVQNFMNVAGTGFKAWENGSIYEGFMPVFRFFLKFEF